MTSKIPRTSIPCLNSGCYHILTLFPISISIASCSCLSLHSVCLYSCKHCLCCVLSHTSDIPAICSLPDSIYKTLSMYVIWYVQILTLIIVLIVYSTLVHPTSLWTSELQLPDFQKYSSSIINSTLLSIKAMLSSGLTSRLLNTDYRNTWMCDSRLVQCTSWATVQTPSKALFLLSSAVH